MVSFLKNVGCRCLVMVWGGLAVLFAAGCREEAEIRQFEVPRIEAKRGPWRLLGAIIPRNDQVWFFRLEGSEEKIAALQGDFDSFIKSIRFTDKEQDPITWKLPEGWRQEGGDKQFRFATIKIGAKEPLGMTVIPLPRERGADSVFANVIRWRDQMGLDPIRESELDQCTSRLKVDGFEVTKVDLHGFKVARRRPGMMAGAPRRAPAPAAAKSKAALTYDVPESWQEVPAGGIRVAAFKVKDGNEEAEVTIIPLAKGAGSVLANVNRWRGEVDLPPIAEGQLAKDVESITVDGLPGQYVDLPGPRLRTLAVMLERDDQTWFFKMRGQPALVGKQKTAFERFVKSVKF